MDKRVFGCFLLGASLGVGISMLIAPQSGQQMRGRFKGKAHEGTEYLKQRGSALRKSAANLLSKANQGSAERRLDEEAEQRMVGEGGPIEATV